MSAGSNPITSSKWAVCTTIHKVTAAIEYFADVLDWAIVVVGDQVMDDSLELSGKNAVYLDASSQVEILSEYRAFLELLPWRHFGRKNIGYVYAILNGAELIWDFDDDNFIKAWFLQCQSWLTIVFMLRKLETVSIMILITLSSICMKSVFRIF